MNTDRRSAGETRIIESKIIPKQFNNITHLWTAKQMIKCFRILRTFMISQRILTPQAVMFLKCEGIRK